MNIVRFKDIILNRDNSPELPQEDRDLFNRKFKGKYAYCVNWIYVIALEDITYQEYIDISTGDDNLNVEHLDLELVKNYVDLSATQDANMVEKYLLANEFTPDSDITIDELKLFRTKLADMLYKAIGYNLDNITKEMLNYYQEEMLDNTIEHLSYFANDTEHDLISTTNTSTCGCQNHTQMLNNQYAISSCNPIYIYRKGVYEKMVSVFSDIDFWLKLDKVVLNEIKRYIDGIIECNLPLYTSQFSTTLHDCGCLTKNSAQEERMQILKDLSSCFYFLATDNYINKKNHISLTLNNWASLLYERMRWY